MKSDYFVRYGVNFSHLTEIEIFSLYRDACEFFNNLDRDTYQSAFLYKQGYTGNGINSYAEYKVEYKKHYTEINNNTSILDMMREGVKL